VCFHETLEKPQREWVTQGGQSGYTWSLPYRVSKGRYDQDSKKVLCTTYDVVFHDDVQMFLQTAQFKKFVCDTAIDGINKVVAEH